jgi:hypothetical protein
MLDSIKQNLPEVKLDFLPDQREAKNRGVDLGKGLAVMGAAALGVFLSEKLKVPGSPENIAMAKLAEYTAFAGETGQRAIIVGLATGAGAGAATQLDRLRPADVVEINGETVPKDDAIDTAKENLEEIREEHEAATRELAEAIGVENPVEADLGELIGQLKSFILTMDAAGHEAPSDEDLRTRNLSNELAVVLIESADSPEDISHLIEGEDREDVLEHASKIQENAAFAA